MAPRSRTLAPMREAVVLVHGIWMTGLDLLLLRTRLRRAGFDATIVRYPSLRRSPAWNGLHLRQALHDVRGDTVHLVGHSLGGLVILHMLRQDPPARPGRVVLMGSPVNGSGVARCVSRRSVTRPFIGRSDLAVGLDATTEDWGGRDVGTIAGTNPKGVGRMVGGLVGPSDGTVAVAETRLPHAADHVEVPVTHVGLVVSRTVAGHVTAFLRTGRFDRSGTGDR